MGSRGEGDVEGREWMKTRAHCVCGKTGKRTGEVLGDRSGDIEGEHLSGPL